MPALRPSSLISNTVDYLNLTKDTYTNVHSIFDFKSTKLETTLKCLTKVRYNHEME